MADSTTSKEPIHDNNTAERIKFDEPVHVDKTEETVKFDIKEEKMDVVKIKKERMSHLKEEKIDIVKIKKERISHLPPPTTDESDTNEHMEQDMPVENKNESDAPVRQQEIIKPRKSNIRRTWDSPSIKQAPKIRSQPMRLAANGFVVYLLKSSRTFLNWFNFIIISLFGWLGWIISTEEMCKLFNI